MNRLFKLGLFVFTAAFCCLGVRQFLRIAWAARSIPHSWDIGLIVWAFCLAIALLAEQVPWWL